MKIVFLQDDFPPESFGGAGISTYELALAMKDAGNDVCVITTCRSAADAGESEYSGLKIFKVASDYPSKWRAYVSLYNRLTVRKVEELFKKIEPDLVLVNNVHFHLSYYCIKLAKRYAKVVVFIARDAMTFSFSKLETKKYLASFDYRLSWHDHFLQAKKRWNPLRNFFIRKYLRYADKVIAISEALKEALEQNGIVNVRVIHNGIDANQWVVNEEEIGNFKSKHHFHDKKVLLFGGRLSSSKGGAKVIEALALVCKQVPNTILLVAGSVDEYACAMKQYAHDLGVADRLVFTGWIDRNEVKVACAASDVALMPSICFDAFGRINIEAMALRKPVVGTCYGGTPEVVVDGVTGYIVNPLYPAEIAERVIKLLKNPEIATLFGEAGYDRVRKNFSLKSKVAEYLTLYDMLLKKK